VTALLLLAVGVLTGPAPGASAATTDAGPVPSVMAALGDSITRGFDACGGYADCTSRSWSTGTSTGLGSHYQRLAALNPALTGAVHNDARTGARMDELGTQAGAAVAQGAQYVTVLMGANDVCRPTEADMTPVTTFRAEADAGLAQLHSGLPSARIFVASIPDVSRLWSVGKGSGSARLIWSLGSVCQSMLKNPTSTAQTDVDRRARVRQRVVDDNAQLQAACAAVPGCRYDSGAVFGYPFALSQLSTWDYFHPNPAGQQALAETTYAAGYGW
jgi:lysophospholipase L1-like esterase